MAADPVAFLVQGLASLLAGLLGVSLGAWLTGLYKIKGEITGRAEKIDTILDEVRETAKATELSKITTRAEKLDSILDEVRGTAKVTELSKIGARADELNKIVNEVAETTKASTGVTIATRLEKLDQILTEVRAVTETQKRIEASVERRSRFEEQAVLDRYNAARTVFGQIQRAATDLNRSLSGQRVEGLFRGNELVPLTTAYEMLNAQRYLLGQGLFEILERQASEIRRLGNAQNPQEQADSKNRYVELQKEFNDEMNRIFRIDRIEWS